MQIKVKRDKSDKDPIVVHYDFGHSVEDACRKFDGESLLDKVVFGLFVLAAKQQLQEFVRRLIAPTIVIEKVPAEKGKKATTVRKEVPSTLSPRDIQEKVNAWRPTVEKASKRSIAAAAKVVDALSPAERDELLKRLLGGSGEPENDARAELEDADVG